MNIKIAVSFFRRQISSVLMFFLLSGLTILTFFLYDLPLEPVLYSIILCAVFELIYLTVAFLLYKKRADELESAKTSILIDISALPDTSDYIGECYTGLVSTLFNMMKQLENDTDKKYHELIDYYTLWVHQIKVPLSALKLLLQSNGIEDKNIYNELFKIEQYVNLVLQFLRMDSLSSDLVLDKYSLDSIVRQAVRNYSTLFIGKEISLNLSELNTVVLTDEKWLVFVIEQILSNALKYTAPKGKISIYMEDARTLAISDTGIGIAPDNLSRIFDRGFTGYNGREVKSSTGLGLYLCKRVLTKLSHTIQINSQSSEGTTVLIGLGSIDLWVE